MAAFDNSHELPSWLEAGSHRFCYLSSPVNDAVVSGVTLITRRRERSVLCYSLRLLGGSNNKIGSQISGRALYNSAARITLVFL
jgi:hypothetical protein